MPYDWNNYTPRYKRGPKWYRRIDWGLCFALFAGTVAGWWMMWPWVVETVKILKQILERW